MQAPPVGDDAGRVCPDCTLSNRGDSHECATCGHDFTVDDLAHEMEMEAQEAMEADDDDRHDDPSDASDAPGDGSTTGVRVSNRASVCARTRTYIKRARAATAREAPREVLKTDD